MGPQSTGDPPPSPLVRGVPASSVPAGASAHPVGTGPLSPAHPLDRGTGVWAQQFLPTRQPLSHRTVDCHGTQPGHGSSGFWGHPQALQVQLLPGGIIAGEGERVSSPGSLWVAPGAGAGVKHARLQVWQPLPSSKPEAKGQTRHWLAGESRLQKSLSPFRLPLWER